MEKRKKLFLEYSFLGLLFGIFCAYMATIRKPVPITEWVLIGAIYNRVLIGISLFLLIPIKKKINKWALSFITGFLISMAMSLPFGIGGIGFGIIGGVYGILIELIIKIINKNTISSI